MWGKKKQITPNIPCFWEDKYCICLNLRLQFFRIYPSSPASGSLGITQAPVLHKCCSRSSEGPGRLRELQDVNMNIPLQSGVTQSQQQPLRKRVTSQFLHKWGEHCALQSISTSPVSDQNKPFQLQDPAKPLLSSAQLPSQMPSIPPFRAGQKHPRATQESELSPWDPSASAPPSTIAGVRKTPLDLPVPCLFSIMTCRPSREPGDGTSVIGWYCHLWPLQGSTKVQVDSCVLSTLQTQIS